MPVPVPVCTQTRLAVGGLVLHALRPRSGVMPAKGARAIMLCDVCDAIYFHLVNPRKIARTTVPMLVADAYSNSGALETRRGLDIIRAS